MRIGNATLKRLGAFQGEPDEHGSVPWLRCPSIDGQPIKPFTRTLAKIVAFVNDTFGTNCNIAKIQQYMHGNAVIHSHSDKVIDLAVGEPIFIIHAGAPRDLVMTPKPEPVGNDELEPYRFRKTDNSCVILTYDDNLKWCHGVCREETREAPPAGAQQNNATPDDASNARRHLSEKERAEASITIVLRETVTFKRSDGWLTGPRTAEPTARDLAAHDDSDDGAYTQAMVETYSTDNRCDTGLDIYESVIKNAARV